MIMTKGTSQIMEIINPRDNDYWVSPDGFLRQDTTNFTTEIIVDQVVAAQDSWPSSGYVERLATHRSFSSRNGRNVLDLFYIVGPASRYPNTAQDVLRCHLLTEGAARCPWTIVKRRCPPPASMQSSAFVGNDLRASTGPPLPSPPPPPPKLHAMCIR